MKFSKRSIETLLDLVEIKLSSLEVHDGEDARARHALEAARSDLLSLRSVINALTTAARKTAQPATLSAPDPRT